MKSIRSKMLLWFGATLAMLMMVFGVITYADIKGTVLPLARDLNQEILKARSAEVGRLMLGYLNEVRAIATREPIKSGNMEDIRQDLVSRAGSINPDFEILFFSDARGDYITTKNVTGNAADRAYWKAIMEQGQDHAISNPLISRSTGATMFVVASVVTDRGGERIGVVAATVQLKTLTQIVNAIKIGESGTSWIVDNTGLIVAHPNPALPMQLNLLRASEMGYKEGLEDIGRKIVLGEAGQGSYVRPNGDRFVSVFSPIPNTPGWSFGIALQESEYLKRPEQLIRRITWLMGAMLAVVLVVVTLLSRRIAGPVQQLRDGVSAVSSGNLDHRLDIRTGDEIQALADAFNAMNTDLKEHIQKLTETTAVKERIQSELNVATDIQASLLPRLFPAFPDRLEFDIYATMDPAKEVGGDFYDFFFIDATHLCFLIADVSDKGVPAALYMMVAKTLLKTEAQRLGDPALILASVNNILAAGNDRCMFATVFCAILDTSSGEVRYANAGHNPPLLFAQNGFSYLHPQVGLVLGPMPEIAYTTEQMRLSPGDMLFLYTDGVTEALNRNQELYGETRLLQALRAAPLDDLMTLTRHIRDEVSRHADGAPQSDDVTLVALTWRGCPATSSHKENR